MNSQRAKEILLLYRPHTDDSHDPEIASALEYAAHDPELRHWLQEHSAFQNALRERFREIPVPEGLKQQIISERKAYTQPPFWRRRAALPAIAAGVMLLLLAGGSWVWQLNRSNPFTEFRNRMARIVLREYPKMNLETHDLAQIRNFLAKQNAHGDYVLPAGLAQAKGTGCAILDWRGQRVSMVCFDSGSKSDTNDVNDLFLFVIDRAAVPKAPAKAPRFAQLNRLATLSWTEGKKTYILGGFGDETFVRRYL